MLTPDHLKAASREVTVTCGVCKATKPLDLLALIVAGRGNMDLEEAWAAGKFRCDRCGSHACTLHVEA